MRSRAEKIDATAITGCFRRPSHTSLFTIDSDLDFGVCVFLINVDGQVVQVFDQFFQILRLDLRQVDGDALFLQGDVGAT